MRKQYIAFKRKSKANGVGSVEKFRREYLKCTEYSRLFV